MELWKLKDMLCNELDEIVRKGELNAGDLDAVHKLTDTIKNVYKIECLKDENEYSMRPYAHSDYMQTDSYRAPHYVRGHYSREAGDKFSSEIHRFMDESNLNEADKQALRRALDIINR